MNPSRIFILRPIATTLLMFGVVLMGIVAYKQLPVSALPEVDYPTMQVLTQYPGASPDVMASSVTTPLERQFGEIPALSNMTSTSSQGLSVITLQFSLSKDIDVAEQEVQEAINAASAFLPANLPLPPIYSKVNPADAPILTLALTSDTMPLSQVEDFADSTLAQKISQIAGVGLVSITGGQKPAVRVQANPLALASAGLSLEDLRTVLGQANADAAKGSFDGPHLAYTITDNDQLIAASGYRDVVVAYRNGAAVRVKDVADVVDGVENSRLAAWQNGKPAVIVNIQRQPGANIISVADSIKTLLPRLEATAPAGVTMNIVADRTSTIRASVDDVQFELMLTIGLVVLVIFIFLRSLWATVIPAVAVPLSLVGTFGIMYLLGFSLNNLSLMALTISTGFVVDDAIVMIENITRYIEEGEPPLEAALKGSKQIGFTIVSLTVSLIAVLIPLLFMGDIVGRLFREFAVTLSVTILVSAVVSLTLTPMMCAKLLKPPNEADRGRFYQWSERMFERAIAFYGRGVKWVIRHQFLTLMVTLATLVLTIILYIIVPKGFFPEEDTGQILGITEARQGISFPAMAQLQEKVAAVVMQDPDVDSVSSFIGVDGTNTTGNSGRLQINLKPLNKRGDRAPAIIARLQPKLAQVEGITTYMQSVADLSVADVVSRTEYQYSLEDADATELAQWAPKLVDKLKQFPQLRDVASDAQNGGLQMDLTIDRDTAARFGILPQTIDDTLYDAFGQRQVSTIFTQLNQYHVVLEVDPLLQQSPEALKNIYVKSSTGTQVPLSAFAHFTPSNTPLTINHEGQFPSVTLSFNLAPNVSLGEAVKVIQKAEKDINLPPSVVANFQGTAAAFLNSLANEWILVLAAIITVYIVLGVLYESYIHPITILSTLPSAGVGAIVALQLFGQDLGIIALIGIILLIGIVKKNAIMMIDFALEAQRVHGMEPVEAIYQACLLRFRPIMMTTMAALLGGVPLALGSGVGAELRRPLGITIVGGLIVSQVLTLYTTPVVYLYFDRLAARFRKNNEQQLDLPLPEQHAGGAPPAPPAPEAV